MYIYYNLNAMSTTGYDALYETLKANADSLPLRYRRSQFSLKHNFVSTLLR
ncbi:MAG: hypothetical protein V7K32_04235 [Nostoc sp.]|uniref:hypothetical protein n=1 Tax=Nostoc sp. TaxID=1180 RepID=UPI002FF8FDAF